MNNKVITFGEIMLRLQSPGKERFLQSPTFEAGFGGGEANVAVSLAQWGMNVGFVSALPDNDIANICISNLRRFGVDTTHIIFFGKRMGIYFLEVGANQRPSKVIYDREGSSIALADTNIFDWNSIFEGVSWFHISGITPAISELAAINTLNALEVAREKGVTISCDLNYRKNLWNYGKDTKSIMRNIFKYVDIGIGNEEDIQKALEINEEGINDLSIRDGNIQTERYKNLCEKLFEEFPNIKKQAITLRKSMSADSNQWSACLHNKKEFIESKIYKINNIVDRIGTGDAFSAGLIFCFIKGLEDTASLEFATAASCLKHSILGDFNQASLNEIENLINGDSTGRVQR